MSNREVFRCDPLSPSRTITVSLIAFHGGLDLHVEHASRLFNTDLLPLPRYHPPSHVMDSVNDRDLMNPDSTPLQPHRLPVCRLVPCVQISGGLKIVAAIGPDLSVGSVTVTSVRSRPP